MAHKEDIHSCDLDLFIVNDLGRVVADNHVDSCASNEEQVSANGNLFDIFDWQLTNEEGCMIDSGKYTIIVEENNRFLSFDFSRSTKELAKCWK